MSFRAARRAVALGLALVLCVVRFWLGRLQGPYTLERRALWLHSTARLVMTSLGIGARLEGRPPTHGLVVANHLSYLDIVILSAVMPCFFVSKVEVDGWPFFGEAARSGGTIFLDRASRSSANRAADHPPDRSAEAIRPVRRGGVTANPVVRPGASRLDRLSTTTTCSGARSASGGWSSRRKA